MGRPFVPEPIGDGRCEAVSYDPDLPITPEAFALPNRAVRLLRDAADTAADDYAELGFYQFDAFLRIGIESLRLMVTDDRTYAEAVSGMLYLVVAEHVAAGRCPPDLFWVRLLQEFANKVFMRIEVVRNEPDAVVLKAAGYEDDVTCPHGRVVAFMGRVYYDYNTREP